MVHSDEGRGELGHTCHLTQEKPYKVDAHEYRPYFYNYRSSNFRHFCTYHNPTISLSIKKINTFFPNMEKNLYPNPSRTVCKAEAQVQVHVSYCLHVSIQVYMDSRYKYKPMQAGYRVQIV